MIREWGFDCRQKIRGDVKLLLMKSVERVESLLLLLVEGNMMGMGRMVVVML